MSNIANIPFVDLKAQYRLIAFEIDKAISKVISDFDFIRGKYVQEFEKKFAIFCSSKHCVGVGNGTDALFVALKSLNIGPGDEVIVPANTFIAIPEAVSITGAKVVFIDCDPQTYNIDVQKIPAQITERTRAIIPVHLYGQPADMDTIQIIARKNGLKIVQDCAQAHGATIAKKPLSLYGDILCFSFYPSKNLGAMGDAGALVTNDDDIAKLARMFANHGRLSKYEHMFEGINSRMDGIQAAILNVKLKYLLNWTEKRKKIASLYNQMLYGAGDVVTPHVMSNFEHVYHLYVIRTKKRDVLKEYLKNNGIHSGIHYPIALPNLQAYRYLGHTPRDFPVASMYQNEILSLPIYPELKKEMIEYIASKVKEFFSQ
jgi:dTDP-4-amino-4,6-dideoxygalactose transaminase